MMQINWNRFLTIFAVIAVLFLFTRSAPLPAGTFWELVVAKDFAANNDTFVLLPELLALKLVNPQTDLLGLKALHHILFFLICSGLAFYVFKGKEKTLGLLVLCVFALFTQTTFHIRDLFLSFYLLSFFIIIDSKISVKIKGFILTAITALCSLMGLEGWILIIIAFCYSYFSKNKINIYQLVCILIGYLVYPKGIEINFNSNLIINKDFIYGNDINILLSFSLILLILNCFFIKKLVQNERPLMVFYVLLLILTTINFKFLPLFLLTGIICSIKGFSKCEVISFNFRVFYIVTLTIIIYFYLTFNPFGFKLNNEVNKQISKNLASIINGYDSFIILESNDLGEIFWKDIISFNKNEFENYFKISDWQLTRDDEGIFNLTPMATANTNNAN